MTDKYKDMLYLQHPEPVGHPRMLLQDRAAQFSPFAALTGYEDALRETARQTEQFIELDEDRKQEIDRQIFYLRQHLKEQFNVKITYFVPDSRKEGGKYLVSEGQVQKIDETGKCLWMEREKIPIDSIFEMDFCQQNHIRN